MDDTFRFLRGLAILLSLGGLVGYLFYRWFRNTREERPVLVIKWLVSAVVIVAMLVWSRDAGPFMVIIGLLGGGVLAILWTPSVAGFVIGKIDDLFTGGSEAAEPAPFYSKAMGHRQRGEYQEAIEEVERQLAMFPDDLEGHLLLADIHAREQHNLGAAQAVLEDFCDRPETSPHQVASALTALADMHLDLQRDREAARQALLQICSRLPGTGQETVAEQRLARMADPSQFEALHDRRPIRLRHGPKDRGVNPACADEAGSREDPETTIAQLALHLEDHPHDSVAREQLAILYADHYRDLELATQQVEVLLNLENQATRNKVRWLNLLADLQIRRGAAQELIRATLQRIVELHPNGAAAEQARQRMEYIQLELKAHQASRPVKFQPKGISKPPPGNAN